MTSQFDEERGEENMRLEKRRCLYVETCPLLIPRFDVAPEEVEERYTLVCTTDQKYNCSQFAMLGARE